MIWECGDLNQHRLENEFPSFSGIVFGQGTGGNSFFSGLKNLGFGVFQSLGMIWDVFSWDISWNGQNIHRDGDYKKIGKLGKISLKLGNFFPVGRMQ